MRHDGAGLDGVHRATAVPDASSASGRYGTGNPLEKIANTGHIGRRRRRHPANVGSTLERPSQRSQSSSRTDPNEQESVVLMPELDSVHPNVLLEGNAIDVLFCWGLNWLELSSKNAILIFS